MSASEQGQREFGRWRSYLWHVHRYELKKLIPLLVIFFLITFDYNVLRTMKDTLVLNGEKSGAEAIPFIKVWAMFPMSILMTFIFTRLSNRFSRDTVIYTMFSAFLLFFFVFAFILYPARDFFHPHASADSLQAALPPGFKGMIAMYRNWLYTAFYVMAELWGNIVLFVLFWGFANQITRLGEAKRFYGILGMASNVSGIFAGEISVSLYRKELDTALPFGATGWEQTMIMLIVLILISGIMAMGIFYWLNKYVLTEARYKNVEEVNDAGVIVKSKLSMRESFSYLMRSKYLLSLAFIVIAFNIVINLVEVVWKHEVHELYPDPSDYSRYMNHVTSFIAIVATLAALFVSGNAVRKYGWTFTAMLTPIILLITSIGFFGCFLAKGSYGEVMISLMGVSPLALAVFFGTSQNVASRAAKYSVFDSTKEIAFIPLSSEVKLKGKAAIDGVGARLGKSSGSLIHQSLLLTLASFTASAPYVAVFLLVITALWMVAVKVMGKQFVLMTESQTGQGQSQEELLKETERGIQPNSGKLIVEQPAI
jgi:AAA family ATP:ADP antiporter